MSEVADVYSMLRRHLVGHRTCVQAGTFRGEWAAYLAKQFWRVYTFEPQRLAIQFALPDNVFFFNAALADSYGCVDMRNDTPENPGAAYVTAGDHVPKIKLDDFRLKDVDLIYLDVEGYEYFALVGAGATIMKYRPVIGIEEKSLYNRYATMNPRHLLINSMRYREAFCYKNDIIFIPNER